MRILRDVAIMLEVGPIHELSSRLVDVVAQIVVIVAVMAATLANDQDKLQDHQAVRPLVQFM